ncbi:INOSITOL POLYPHOSPHATE MULTIKINASE [Salix viminalis]|uniref:Inositol polyphosphate multikinase n=1 Tax=Salix viminalis TaxID=40686 RepID=A0A9Q0NM07_SALVM|nr:INOSITOL POLYPHOSPHATE MULTIKINASE [Salix viminalis]
MLKVPDHQVAGHQAGHGHPGPLIDDSGRFYKPLQDDDRGAIEAAFYTSFSSNTRVPDHIRRFFPVFYGTKLLEASDGSGQWPHLVLEDVVSGLSHPSVMDVKIGSRTWYPEASEDYIQRCFMKDRKTSSLDLGFRISGLQLYGSEESGLWKPDRKLVQHLSADEVRVVLKKFVSSNSPIDPNLNPDCSFASSVYGGSSGILAQLLELKSWFEDQTIYHLNSCSVLMVYDKKKELKGESSDAIVKLIDFAHVTEGNGIIDHNFVGGLCSLIKFISDILTSPDECTTKACLQNSDNNNEEILTGQKIHSIIAVHVIMLFQVMGRKIICLKRKQRAWKEMAMATTELSQFAQVAIKILRLWVAFSRTTLLSCNGKKGYLPDSYYRQASFLHQWLPCKNPNSVAASDFKSSKLSHPGDTHNFLRSSLTLDMAADFPGLNTLGLSIARTDLEVDGLTVPHSHPRASEILFVSTGLVIAGFFDTQKKLFLRTLKPGEVFVVPQGLLHFIINYGDEAAVIFSVLNSQNPGVAKIVDATFESDEEMMDKLARKMKSAAGMELEEDGIQNVSLTEFNHVHTQ